MTLIAIALILLLFVEFSIKRINERKENERLDTPAPLMVSEVSKLITLEDEKGYEKPLPNLEELFTTIAINQDSLEARINALKTKESSDFNWDQLTIRKLQKIASSYNKMVSKEEKIKRFSKIKKKELIEQLIEHNVNPTNI